MNFQLFPVKAFEFGTSKPGVGGECTVGYVVPSASITCAQLVSCSCIVFYVKARAPAKNHKQQRCEQTCWCRLLTHPLFLVHYYQSICFARTNKNAGGFGHAEKIKLFLTYKKMILVFSFLGGSGASNNKSWKTNRTAYKWYDTPDNQMFNRVFALKYGKWVFFTTITNFGC